MVSHNSISSGRHLPAFPSEWLGLRCSTRKPVPPCLLRKRFSVRPAMAASPNEHQVTAPVVYTEEPPAGESLFSRVPPEGGTLGPDEIRTNITRLPFDVHIQDLHELPRSWSIRKNGFQLEELKVPGNLDWNDPEQVQESLLDLASGARQSAHHHFSSTLIAS